MTVDGAELFKQREQRFNDIVALKKPDRVPVVPLALDYFPTRIKGISDRVCGYDHIVRTQAYKEATIEFGWDFAPPTGLMGHDGFAALATKQFRWPGGDLRDDEPFQFIENEYLKADEYDEFLADPNGFTLTKIFPRIAANLEGFGEIPLPPLYWLSNMYYLQMVGGSMMAMPALRTALKALLDLGDAADANNRATVAYTQEMAALGYPMTFGGIIVPAYDIVSDTLRSLRGSTLDMFRHPEKLLATIDLMQVPTLALAVQAAEVSHNPRVFIPMHRGARGFMSEEQFERFYWPTFKALIEALVARDLTPVPLFEGDYTPRLKYLAELPAGKVAAHFDKVDAAKFKEVCGQTMCFWGDIPLSLLCEGSAEQVKDYVKRLIDLFADTGTLMLDGRTSFPPEAKPENVLAVREAADEYGVF
jgi:hypothetical protein